MTNTETITTTDKEHTMTENIDLSAGPNWPDLLYALEWCGHQRAGYASPLYAQCDRADGHDGPHAEHDRETGAVTATWSAQ